MVCLKVFILLLLTASAHGAEFIGVEGETTKPEPAEEQEQNLAPKSKEPQRSKAKTSARKQGRKVGTWSGYGMLTPGLGYFSASVGLKRHVNPYVVFDFGGFFQRRTERHQAGEAYGVETNLILQLANSFRVVPFVGAGPGYEQWRRWANELVFDRRGALTAQAFLGASVRLTDHFGVTGRRLVKRYVTDQGPRQFLDQKRYEAREQIATTVGFYARF